MDTHEKLDKIIELLESELQEIKEELQELREAILNLDNTGSGYSTFNIPGEED